MKLHSLVLNHAIVQCACKAIHHMYLYPIRYFPLLLPLWSLHFWRWVGSLLQLEVWFEGHWTYSDIHNHWFCASSLREHPYPAENFFFPRRHWVLYGWIKSFVLHLGMQTWALINWVTSQLLRNQSTPCFSGLAHCAWIRHKHPCVFTMHRFIR